MFNSIHIWFLWVCLFLLACPQSKGQDQASNSKREHLLTLLQRSKPDTNRVNVLLDLGWHYLYKRGELQTDIDTAGSYMKQAEKLSNSLVSFQHKPSAHHVKVLLTLSKYYCLKPLELKPDLDTAMGYVKRAERFSQVLHIPLGTMGLELLGNLYWEKHDTTRAQQYFMQAVRQYEQRKDTASLASIWDLFGEHYPHSLENMVPKVNCYKRAFTYYHQGKNQTGEIRMIDYIIYTCLLQQKTQLALTETRNVLRLYQSENYPLLDYINYRLSGIELRRSNYKAAIQHGMKALQLAQSNPANSRIGEYNFQIGKIYRNLGNEQKSIDYYWQALSDFRRSNDATYIHTTARLICNNLISQKKAAKAFLFYQTILKQYPANTGDLRIESTQMSAALYEATKRYDLAESHYLKLLSLVAKYQDRDVTKVDVYSEIGKFYLNQKQYAKASYYLTWHFNHVTSPIALQASFQNLSKLDSAQGNFQTALAHFQQYSALKDSIFTATKAKQIDELLIQYETQDKEHRIDLLTTQARVQQARVQQANLIRNVTIGGAAMLLILLGLIYSRYRMKQNQQTEIQLKNNALEVLVSQKDGLLKEKEWLLKEVHHRVKNNLQLIISLLQSQSKYLLDEAAIKAIEQSEYRVRSMALIHQKLYRSQDLSQINMSAYIVEVVEQLRQAFDPNERIAFQYALAPMELDISQAVPLGLIINEAITNSLKYAFPDTLEPADYASKVAIALAQVDTESFLLIVEDNGVGLPKGVSLLDNNSMGSNIMRGLSKQLGGILQVNSSHGVKISILFSLLKPHSSPVNVGSGE